MTVTVTVRIGFSCLETCLSWHMSSFSFVSLFIRFTYHVVRIRTQWLNSIQHMSLSRYVFIHVCANIHTLIYILFGTYPHSVTHSIQHNDITTIFVLRLHIFASNLTYDVQTVLLTDILNIVFNIITHLVRHSTLFDTVGIFIQFWVKLTTLVRCCFSCLW